MATTPNETPAKPIKMPVRKSEKVNKILPTDRLSVAKQLEILRAYGALAESSAGGVTNAAVAKIVDMAATTITLSNAFFNDVGFIQRNVPMGFIISSEVIAFCHAHDWNQEKAPQKLAPLLNKTWFADALIPKLKFRPMKIEDAIQSLAEASFADKSYFVQLRMLVDYLTITGIVLNDNGEIRLNREGVQPPQDPIKPNTPEDKTYAAAKAAGQAPETFTLEGSPLRGEHSLFLDKDKQFTISSPLFITKAEFDRIVKWIEVTLIIDDGKKNDDKQ